MNKEDAEGGHNNGGNDKIWPFGRPDSAMEIPAMWYLECQGE